MSIDKEYNYINLSDWDSGVSLLELKAWVDTQIEKGNDTVMLEMFYEDNLDAEACLDTMNLIAY